MLEGSTRGSGRTAPSEISSLLWGVGLRPNGAQVQGLQDGIGLRARWREERGPLGRTGSGSLRLEVGGLSLGLRSEDGGGHGTSHIGSLGGACSRGRAWIALTDRLDPAFAFRFDTASQGTSLFASGRRISAGIRHGGLPSGWSGSTAGEFGGRFAFEDRGSVRLKVQGAMDSADDLRVRGEVRSLTRFRGQAFELGGTCTRESGHGLWSGLLAGWSASLASLRPEISHSWTDSSGSFRNASLVSLGWRTAGGALRGQVRWDWARTRGYALLSRQASTELGAWRIRSSLEGGRDLRTGRVVAQGSVQCAW